MVEARVKTLVFSSTCAVYGEPSIVPIVEIVPDRADQRVRGDEARDRAGPARTCEKAHGLRWIALRYFNAAGAHPDGTIGEAHDPEIHLIPRAIEAAHAAVRRSSVFGEDYPTPDGTCIRDYIHVCDLADAHLRALAGTRAGAARSGRTTSRPVTGTRCVR